MKKEPLDEERLVHAISQVLKRLADLGWVDSTVIMEGRLSINYSPLGKDRMHTLKSILIDEIDSSLNSDQLAALIGLLLQFNESIPVNSI